MPRKFLGLIFAAICHLSYAESLDEFFESSLAEAYSPEKIETAKKVLNEKPTFLNNAYFQKRFNVAQYLGDYETAIKISKDWIARDSGEADALLIPRWELSWMTFAMGNVEEGIRLSEDVYKYLRYKNQEAQFASQFAYRLAYIGRVDEAQTNLKLAQSALLSDYVNIQRPNSWTSCGRERAALQIQQTKTFIGGLRGDYDFITQGLDKALEMKSVIKACESTYIDGRNDGLRAYVSVMNDKIRHLLLGNKVDEAELLLNEAIALSIEKKHLPIFATDILESLTALNVARGRWIESKRFAELYEKSRPPLETSINLAGIVARQYRTDSLIGLGQWDEALTLQDSTDKLVQESPNFLAIWQSPLRRTLVFLKNGKVSEALIAGKDAVSGQAERFGPNHFLTTQAAGVNAMALFASGDLLNARQNFEIAFGGLLRPHGIVPGAENTGINKIYAQLILYDYLRLLERDYLAGDSEAASRAFKVAELLRGSSVQRSIVEAAARSALNVTGLKELVREEQDAEKQLSTLYEVLARKLNEGRTQLPQEVVKESRTRIAALESELKQLNARITREFPDYANLVSPQPAGLQEVAKKLSDKEALISTLVTPQRSYAWAVTADLPPKWVAIDIRQAEVDALVANLRKTLDLGGQLTGGSFKFFDTKASYALYQKFLQPLKANWETKEALVVSPSGKLAQIPWGVLLTQDTPQSGQYALMPWLIKSASISHVPSVSGWLALKGMQAASATRKPFIGYGDPTFSLASVETYKAAEIKARGRALNVALPTVSTLQYSELPPLPETRDEILAVAKALNADLAKDVYLGERATRANVIGQPLIDRRIISFATHGLVAGDLPQLSQPALAMAGTGNSKESPLLTLEDVMNLKLDADWVVLSACNTASSDGKGDEALSGLGRGFFYAGARSILATHWSVESESAAELMTQTFEKYGADNTVTRAQALRSAQLQMSQGKFAHPFYWSAYALVGDGSR